MHIKTKEGVFEVSENIVADYPEIRQELAVKKISLMNAKKAIIKAILYRKELISKYIKKSDAELQEELKQLNKTEVDYDRQGKSGTHLPFGILNNSY